MPIRNWVLFLYWPLIDSSDDLLLIYYTLESLHFCRRSTYSGVFFYFMNNLVFFTSTIILLRYWKLPVFRLQWHRWTPLRTIPRIKSHWDVRWQLWNTTIGSFHQNIKKSLQQRTKVLTEVWTLALCAAKRLLFRIRTLWKNSLWRSVWFTVITPLYLSTLKPKTGEANE